MSSLFSTAGTFKGTLDKSANPDAKGQSITKSIGLPGYSNFLNSLLNLNFSEITATDLQPNDWATFLSKLGMFTFFLLLYTYVGCSYIFILHLSEDEFNNLFPIKPCQYDLRCVGASELTKNDGTVREQGECSKDSASSSASGSFGEKNKAIPFSKRKDGQECITACKDKKIKTEDVCKDDDDDCYCGRPAYKFQGVTGFPYCLQNKLPKIAGPPKEDADEESRWFRISEKPPDKPENKNESNTTQKGGFSKFTGNVSGAFNSAKQSVSNSASAASSAISDKKNKIKATLAAKKESASASLSDTKEKVKAEAKKRSDQLSAFIKGVVETIQELCEMLVKGCEYIVRLVTSALRWIFLTLNSPDCSEDSEGHRFLDLQGPVDWYAHTMQASYINYRWACRYFLEMGGQARGMDKQFDIILMLWGLLVQKLFFVCSPFISTFVTLTMGFTWGWKGLERGGYWFILGSVGWMFFPFLPGVGFALLIMSMQFNILYQFLVIWIGGTLVTPIMCSGAFSELADIFTCNMSYIIIVYCMGIVYSGVNTLNHLTQSVVSVTVFVCIVLYFNGYFDIDKLKKLFSGSTTENDDNDDNIDPDTKKD